MPTKPRERVLATLRHRIPDRVPLLEPWIEDEMAHELGQTDLPATYVNLGLDGFMVPNQAPLESNSWRNGVDEWGRGWHRGTYSGGVIQTREDLRRYSPSLEYAEKFFNAVEIQRVRTLHPDHCLFFGSHIGPFTAAYMAMGFERFFVRLVEDAAFIHELLENRTEWCLAMYKKAVEFGIDIAILGDDAGHNQGPMISPGMWREFVLPHHKRIVEELRVPVIWHSDGAVESLLPQAIEAGFVGLHGMEPESGMDLGKIKREFGKDLVLVGNADLKVMFGSDLEAVRGEVGRCLEQGSPGGGYMFSSCNSIFRGMNPASVMELYRFARENGSF